MSGKKTKNKQVKNGKASRFNTIRSRGRINLRLAALVSIVIAAIGVYFLFFASAATNNCQTQGDLKICDVNQVIKSDGSDALLSVGGEAESLGINKWGTYYGAAFRAPTTPYKGAEPMYRLYSHSLTLHTVKFGPEASQAISNTSVQTSNEGLLFYAWRNNPNLPGVVPVYRVTGTGWSFVDVFVSSQTVYNQLKGDKAAWQDGGVAFWAYPESYTIPGQTNPYDCSKIENFTSERCAGARQEVINKINQETKQAATNAANKQATGTQTNPGNSQSTPTPTPTPTQGGVDCAAPNPTQATKDACLKQLADYIAKQKSATTTSTGLDCSAPNPTQATKDTCLKRLSEFVKKNQGGGSKRDCSSPNPSDYEKYICTTLFLNAAKGLQRASLDALTPGYFGASRDKKAALDALTPGYFGSYKKVVKGDCRLVIYPTEIGGNPYTAFLKLSDWLTGSEANTPSVEKITKNVTGEKCVSLQKEAKSKPLVRDVKGYLINQRYEYVK